MFSEFYGIYNLNNFYFNYPIANKFWEIFCELKVIMCITNEHSNQKTTIAIPFL